MEGEREGEGGGTERWSEGGRGERGLAPGKYTFGGSHWITRSTSGMSNPLAATSVATRT